MILSDLMRRVFGGDVDNVVIGKDDVVVFVVGEDVDSSSLSSFVEVLDDVLGDDRYVLIQTDKPLSVVKI